MNTAEQNTNPARDIDDLGDDDKTNLEEVMRNTFSSEAVAAIANRVLAVDMIYESEEGLRVVRELEWFAGVLQQMVGGEEKQQRICDELGLE